MKILTHEIQELAEPEVYQRGVRYHKQGRVTLTSVNLEAFEAKVRGTHLYRVSVRRKNDYYETSCTCPYGWGVCKHVIAAMLAAQNYYAAHADKLSVYQQSPWRQYLDPMLAPPSSAEPVRVSQAYQWKLFYSLRALDAEETRWIIVPCRVQVQKDGTFGRVHHYAVTLGDLVQKTVTADTPDRLILARLNTLSYYYYYDHRATGASWARTQSSSTVAERERQEALADVLPLLPDRLVYRATGNQPLGVPLSIADAPASLEFRLQKRGEDLELFPVMAQGETEERVDGRFRVVLPRPLWLLRENQLIPVNGEVDGEVLRSFIRANQPITISPADADRFFEEYFLPLQQRCPIRTDVVTWKTVEVPRSELRKRLYLKEHEGQLQLELRFAYDRWEVPFGSSRKFFREPAEPVFVQIVRHTDAEQQAGEMLWETGVKSVSHNGAVYSPTTDPLLWLAQYVPILIERGFEIYGEESLQHHRLNRQRPQLQLVVSSEIDWFDLNLSVKFGDQSVSLDVLKEALHQGRRFVRLDDGSLGLLPEDWLQKYRHLFDFAEQTDAGLRLSKYHLTLIDELCDEAAQHQVDDAFLRKREKLRRFTAIQAQPVPQGFRGQLRPYQKAGYDWLYFLQEFGFGGCLADDMGLGKTICTLALLQGEKERGEKCSDAHPSLIVVPTSLVFNWLAEAARFTPDLKICAQTGAKRLKTTDGFHDYDLILTTYGTLRKDIAWLRDFRFHYVILDESQQIKNPVSQIAKAVKLLRATHRLVLSGTPVENNTLELWSQLAFLNPGLLGNLTYFKESFARAIEKEKDTASVAFLKRLLYPFILRRTKDQVAADLPPKVENVVYCELEPAQRRRYEQWRDYYRAAVLGLIDEQGLNKSRMKILEGLTKLRQICCHPVLVEPEYRHSSGKLELFKELLTNILAEGHKVLVFSQFVKMLRVVRQYLDDEEIPYAYLDGQTPPRQRKEHVERFQSDATLLVFLISLKAGGVGLNLTAADYVIHIDPWWNPAVEVQATDRTHRIGQTRNVFAYKLITKGTVEEKILELQERKRQLVQQLITTESGFFKRLTREDVRALFS